MAVRKRKTFNTSNPGGGRSIMRSTVLACVLLVASGICFEGRCRAAGILDTLGAKYVLSFDGDWQDSLNGILIERQGGTQISDGVIGSALSLGVGEYLALDASKLVNPAEGTIEFWVRPHWTQASSSSHTFLSMTWTDGRNGYFVLSRGWWEPDGAPFTYYIHNNQDYLYVTEQMLYSTTEWTHFACVWKIAPQGFVRFYVNGSKVGEVAPPATTTPYPVSGPLFLGTDKGCPYLSQGRSADSDFDEIATFDKALDDGQIMSIYNAQNPNPAHYPPIGADGYMQENRVIFDENEGWTTEQGARDTIRRIKAAGFNVYVPCVWHGSGTRYPATLAPSEPGLDLSGGDPLARLIKIAHENGIKVHAWFTVTLRQLDFLNAFYGPGTPPEAFDIERPDFGKFISDVIVDVATRYDVDGINLDYIRTMGLCSCSYCQTQYQAATGRNLLNDIAQAPATGNLPPYLQQWEDQAVEAVVRQVYLRIKDIKPSICVSADAHPVPDPDREGRQAIQWANNGIVDLVFDMDYAEPPDSENHNLMRAQFNDPTKFIELLSNYLTSGDNIIPADAGMVAQNIDRARRRWGDGVGIYWYPSLSDAQVSELGGKILNVPARPLGCSIGSSIPAPGSLKIKTGN